MADIVTSVAASALVDAAGAGGVSLIGGVTLSSVAGTGGSLLGSLVNDALGLSSSNKQRARNNPRLSSVSVMTAGEGAAVPLVYGRARVAGNLLRATRFRETSAGYSISLAIGLCEGPIARLVSVFVDDKPFDLQGVAWRLYLGSATQPADPLFAFLDGGNTTAYRDLAYIVFEDLPLTAYGNRVPQFSFEVVRIIPDADAPGNVLRAVCLIPGTGEFSLAVTSVVRNNDIPVYENRNTGAGASDFTVSLDDLTTAAPTLSTVALTIGRFADSLNAGRCTITPRVDAKNKITRPLIWRSENDVRASAPPVSTYNNGPAYGGTPDDASVVEAIQTLKQRGLTTFVYPLLLCDIPAGNAARQPAYPWRGRIAASSAADVAAFFGAARASDFLSGGNPADRGYRRSVLHYAALCAVAGGVPGFVIGSELAALTRTRVNRTQFPAVDALRALAAEVRVLLPAAKIIYGADWTEYGAYVPNDGSGDVLFPLDALWADPNIDEVALDWYAPLSDTRDDADPEAAGFADRTAFLQSRIRAGEGFDWYYASDADRQARQRTPISDGSYNEPYVYRVKALAEWWSNRHYPRLGGVRQATPTAWVPQSKPVRLLEFGCGAVDRGANAPNVFPDAKSVEGGLPPFSRGTPDAAEQRALINAYLRHYASTGAHNPVSSVYGGAMVTLERMHAWCWDTRPFPAFPGKSAVWRDAEAWSTGHWLNGRLESPSAAALLRALAARADTPASAAGVRGQAYGMTAATQSTALDLLQPTATFFGADLRETGDGLSFAPRDEAVVAAFSAADFTVRGLDAAPAASFALMHVDPLSLPDAVALTYADLAANHAFTVATAGELNGRQVLTVDTLLVSDADTARRTADRIRAEVSLAGTQIAFALPAASDNAQRLLPGCRVAVALFGNTEVYRITRLQRSGNALKVVAVRTEGTLFATAKARPIEAGLPTRAPVTPQLFVLDLPTLRDTDAPPLLRLAAAAAPWPGTLRVYRDDPFGGAPSLVSVITAPAVTGVTVTDLWPGPRERFDRGNALWVQLSGDGVLTSCTQNALFAGTNAAALYNAALDAWEIVQFLSAEPVAIGKYKLSMFLRGCRNTSDAMAAPLPAGATFVLLNDALASLPLTDADLNKPMTLRAVPGLLDPSDDAAAVTTMTPVGYGLRPFAPARLQAVRQGDGSIVCSWVRRSRIGGDDWSAPDVPYPETFERYRVETLDANRAVLQSLIVTSGVVALNGNGVAWVRVWALSERTTQSSYAEVRV